MLVLMWLKWPQRAKHVSTQLTRVLTLYSVCNILKSILPHSQGLVASITQVCFGRVIKTWLLLGSDAAACRQHTGQRGPTDVMCVRSIMGERPIKVLLRFTQQLNRRSESSGLLECMYKYRHTAAYLFQPALHILACVLRKGQALKRWRQSRDIWWWRARCGQQVTFSSPFSSPSRASPCISVKRAGCWFMLAEMDRAKRKREKNRKIGAPKMALNVWKSTLPILAVKLKRQPAQTHESECDRIVEFSMAGTGSNQTNT